MQVRERTRHIDVSITGAGIGEIKKVISRHIPDVVIIDDDSDEEDGCVKWDESELLAEIKLRETPGKILRAYREREGLSIVELSKLTGMRYTNISAMEHDTRVIGLAVARRLGKALHCDYSRFLV